LYIDPCCPSPTQQLFISFSPSYLLRLAVEAILPLTWITELLSSATPSSLCDASSPLGDFVPLSLTPRCWATDSPTLCDYPSVNR
jgi:hypothetical protein